MKRILPTLFRQNKKWLLFTVKAELKRRHPDLFPSWQKNRRRTITDYILDQKRWWLVALFTLTVFFVFPFIPTHFINILVLKPETVQIIVDQRTANIATIISITFVVIGFLINNIAVKEPLAYRLLFKHSRLYPIIYLTLSIIGCFVITSALRDCLHPGTFTRIVLAGCYLVLILLILIGWLFRSIIKAISPQEIIKLLEIELLEECKLAIRMELIKRNSTSLYSSLMTKYGFKEYNMSEALASEEEPISVVEHRGPLPATKTYIVQDVKIATIQKLIKKMGGQNKYFKKLGIDTPITPPAPYVWIQKKTQAKSVERKIQKSVLLGVPKKSNENYTTFRQHFTEKIEQLVEGNHHRELEKYLEVYYKLQEMELKYFDNVQN